MTRVRKSGKGGKKKACPRCGSIQVVAVVEEPTTPAMKAALRQRKAIRSNREDWEGISEWHCNACGSEWRGSWVKFKRPG